MAAPLVMIALRQFFTRYADDMLRLARRLERVRDSLQPISRIRVASNNSNKNNFSTLRQQINDDQRKYRICAAIALTKTAKKCQEEFIRQMERVIDRPTRYALNGTYIRPANTNNLRAEVGIKDYAIKGTPAINFLGHQIHGGNRRHKRFEKALIARNLMPSSMFAMPGAGAKIDGNGNMSRGQIMQVLSALGAAEMRSGYSANRTKQSAKRGKNKPQYFVGRPGGGRLPLGVWQYVRSTGASRVIPILIYGRSPSYGRRLDFFELVDKTANQWFPIFFEREMAKKK